MSKIKWYKRDPVAYLHGTRKLSLEERGAYADVIELIYSHDGKLDDDDEHIAGWLRCHLRKWRTIKARLIKLDKIAVVDGFIVNDRCSLESKEALRLIQTCSKAGEKSGESRRAKSLKSKSYDEQMFVDSNEPTTTINQSLRKKERSPYGDPKKEVASPLAQPTDKRGHRLPDDWKPSESDRLYALGKGLSEAEIDTAAEEFRNFWTSTPGQRGRKTRWDRTWQNRVIEIAERKRTRKHNNGHGNGQLTDKQTWREDLVYEAITGPFGPMALRANGTCTSTEQRNSVCAEGESVPLLRGPIGPH